MTIQVPFLTPIRGYAFAIGMASPLILYATSEEKGYFGWVVLASIVCGALVSTLDYLRERAFIRDSWERWYAKERREPVVESRVVESVDPSERHSTVRPIAAFVGTEERPRRRQRG